MGSSCVVSLDGLCAYKLRVGGFSGIAAAADSITDEIRIDAIRAPAFSAGIQARFQMKWGVAARKWRGNAVTAR
jgi:hypothetical protein